MSSRGDNRGPRPGSPLPRAGSPPRPQADVGQQQPEAPTHLVIGRVLASWGHRGEIRIEILTGFPERFGRLQEIWVGPELRPYRLSAARLHKGNAILKLEGIDDPEQAAGLRGELLYVPLSEAVPLGKDQYYHYQILGLDVYTTAGRHLGHIGEILETGSNDVYVVQGEGHEVLIPAIADVVQEVDLEGHRLIVALPPGLLDEEEA